MLSISVSIIPDGISTSTSLQTASIAASSDSYLALSSFSFSIFDLISAFKSANVSNSLTSFAKSSSIFGNSFFLISCNFTLNVASFPAKSLEK